MRRLKILARKGLDTLLGLRARSRLRRWVRERDAQRATEAQPPRTGRYLYASPVGATGQAQLEKMLERLPAEHFDFLIFVYDGHRFEGPQFERCTFIHEPGVIYRYFKQYITPAVAARYDVIFIAMEDVEVDAFDWRRFIEVMQRNQLDMAAPALSARSITPHKIMYRQPVPVGRLVDVIEVFLTAFDARAWPRFWDMIEPDWNHWGWGYVQLAQNGCGFKMGLVDCETVSVVRPPNFRAEADEGMRRLFAKYKHWRRANFISYGLLR